MDLIVAFLYIVLALLFLGVIVAFSPTLIITELAILTKSKKPLLHTTAFIAGISVPVILLGLLSLLFLEPTSYVEVDIISLEIGPRPLLDILAGSLFIIAGNRLAKGPQNKVSKFQPDKLINTKTLFWFGAIKMATSVSSIAAIIYAARFLKTNTTATLQQMFGLLWLLGVSILPFMLVALSKQFSPNSFNKIQSFSNKISELNWRRIIAIAMIILGVILIISGIFTLDQSQMIR